VGACRVDKIRQALKRDHMKSGQSMKYLTISEPSVTGKVSVRICLT